MQMKRPKYSSEDRLVDFINKAVVIVATQDFTNQLPLPPLPEDPPAGAEPVADPDLQPQPTKAGEGEEAAQIVTSPPTLALEILSRIHWVLDPLDTRSSLSHKRSSKMEKIYENYARLPNFTPCDISSNLVLLQSFAWCNVVVALCAQQLPPISGRRPQQQCH